MQEQTRMPWSSDRTTDRSGRAREPSGIVGGAPSRHATIGKRMRRDSRCAGTHGQGSLPMIRVAAVGDLMLGDSSITVGFGVHARYPSSQLGQLFTELAPRLRGADVAIGNLECALTPVGVGASRWARDQMRGDEAYARVLSDAGFTAIAVANNHAVQHGDAAFERTVAVLRAAGLLVLGVRGSRRGTANQSTYSNGDESVALLAYSWRPRQYGAGPPPYAEVHEAAVLADVARARATHTSVIVSLHWGVEFVTQPSTAEVAFAHEAGRDGRGPRARASSARRPSARASWLFGDCVQSRQLRDRHGMAR